jgi:hypothetical protein
LPSVIEDYEGPTKKLDFIKPKKINSKVSTELQKDILKRLKEYEVAIDFPIRV